MKVQVVPGERKQSAFSNPVINYKFIIFFGKNCPGLLSNRNYKTSILALDAGQRFCKKIKNLLKETNL